MLKNVAAGQLANALSTVSIPANSTLADAAYAIGQLHARALIVAGDEDGPLGYVNDRELLRR